jgi:hypothetical protein
MKLREFIELLSFVSSWSLAHAQEANKAYRVGFVTNVGSVARLVMPTARWCDHFGMACAT